MKGPDGYILKANDKYVECCGYNVYGSYEIRYAKTIGDCLVIPDMEIATKMLGALHAHGTLDAEIVKVRTEYRIYACGEITEEQQQQQQQDND